MAYQQVHIELPKFTEGDYVIFIKADWDALHPIRRLVTNIYGPRRFDIKRVNTQAYPQSVFSMMDLWLGERL
jgi:hypothetical protein